jgi:hypothetical protein
LTAARRATGKITTADFGSAIGRSYSTQKAKL